MPRPTNQQTAWQAGLTTVSLALVPVVEMSAEHAPSWKHDGRAEGRFAHSSILGQGGTPPCCPTCHRVLGLRHRQQAIRRAGAVEAACQLLALQPPRAHCETMGARALECLSGTVCAVEN